VGGWGALERTKVLVWVDRNQLGRRNLTDWQRAVVIGRLYKTIKKAPHRPTKGENGENFTPFRGSHATAKAVAKQVGISEKTVRNAEKFAEAVEALQEISPQAAERVLRGEVRDALTGLPKVPKEALANSQHRSTNKAVAFPSPKRRCFVAICAMFPLLTRLGALSVTS